MEAPSSHIYFSQRLRLHYVAGAGHWPHHDRFDLFMPRVRAFLGA